MHFSTLMAASSLFLYSFIYPTNTGSQAVTITIGTFYSLSILDGKTLQFMVDGWNNITGIPTVSGRILGQNASGSESTISANTMQGVSHLAFWTNATSSNLQITFSAQLASGSLPRSVTITVLPGAQPSGTIGTITPATTPTRLPTLSPTTLFSWNGSAAALGTGWGLLYQVSNLQPFMAQSNAVMQVTLTLSGC